MPSKDSLSEQETAQRERLSRCHDAVEEAEAHLAAEEVPEAWVDTGPEGADFDAALAASAYSLEADVAQELLRPLEAETRGRIADDVVGAYLAERDDGAPAVLPTVGSTPAAANDGGGRRRWWALPMTAVAAVLLTFVYVDLRGSTSASADAFDGTVLLSSTVRGGSERGDPAEAMTLHSGDYFHTHCGAEGREVDIIRVVAKRSDGTGKTYNLRSEAVDSGAGGAVVKVTAELAKGSWSLSCEAEERTSGARSWIGSAATLNVE